MKLKDKAKKVWKKHKVAIIGCAGFAMMIGGVVILSKKSTGASEVIEPLNALKYKMANTPEKLIDMGFDNDYCEYDKGVELISKQDTAMKVKDLGDLGKALCDIPDIDEDCFVWTLVNVAKKTNEAV